jgi:hypothetical protein
MRPPAVRFWSALSSGTALWLFAHADRPRHIAANPKHTVTPRKTAKLAEKDLNFVNQTDGIGTAK